MTEIEKMFENAGIEKDWKPLPYGDIEEYYPKFTTEEQLKIIEWFISYRWWLNDYGILTTKKKRK